MKKSRFTEEQIIKILEKGQSGFNLDELCREHGICKGTYYVWKSKYGGLSISEAQRLRALESENSKLKRLVAEQALDIVALKDVLTKKW